MQIEGALRRQGNFLPLAQEAVEPRFSRLTTREAVGGKLAPLTQQGELGIGEHLHLADEAITSGVLALPTRAFTDGVLLDAQGIGVFKGFDGSVEGVRHVGVDCRGTSGGGGGTHAAAEGLVISEGLLPLGIETTEGEIVHGALTGSRDALGAGLSESAQEDIDDALGGFNVAAGNRGGRQGVEDGTGWGDHLDGHQAASVVGYIQTEQAAENVVDGGQGDGVDGVEGALDLGGGAGKVDDGSIALDGEQYPDGDGICIHATVIVDATVIEEVFETVCAIGQGSEELAGKTLGVGQELHHAKADFLCAVTGDEGLEAQQAALVGGELGTQVTGALLGGAHVSKDQVPDGGVDLPLAEEFDGRDDEAFLVDLAGNGHGAGGHAADIGVVGAAGDKGIGGGGTFEKVGGDEGDVGKVGAAEERVVEDDAVSGMQIEGELLDGSLDGKRHGAEMNRNVGSLGDEHAMQVEEGAGIVTPLFDVGRAGGFAQDETHLFGDGGKEVLEDFEEDGGGGGHGKESANPSLFSGRVLR